MSQRRITYGGDNRWLLNKYGMS